MCLRHCIAIQKIFFRLLQAQRQRDVELLQRLVDEEAKRQEDERLADEQRRRLALQEQLEFQQRQQQQQPVPAQSKQSEQPNHAKQPVQPEPAQAEQFPERQSDESTSEGADSDSVLADEDVDEDGDDEEENDDQEVMNSLKKRFDSSGLSTESAAMHVHTPDAVGKSNDMSSDSVQAVEGESVSDASVVAGAGADASPTASTQSAPVVTPTLDSLLDEASQLQHGGQPVAAAKLFHRAADEFASAEAHGTLGELYLYGAGDVGVNHSRGLAHLQAAAALGDAPAQAWLALLHANGLVSPDGTPDEAKSILHAYFGALGSSTSAKMMMGYRHLHGLGVPQVCSTAAQYYQEVAEEVVQMLVDEQLSPIIERQRLSDEKKRPDGYLGLGWLSRRLGIPAFLDVPGDGDDGGNVHEDGAVAEANGAAPVAGGAVGAGQAGLGQVPNDNALDGNGGNAGNAGHGGGGDGAAGAGNGGWGGWGFGGLMAWLNPGAGRRRPDAPANAAAAGNAGNGRAGGRGAHIGQHAPDGMNVEENVVAYYRHAAQQGDAGAQLALGQLHFYGARGVTQDTAKAAQFFRLAADQGDASAMTNLGHMHLNGVGVEQNNNTALELFRKAADKGSVAAMNGLGFLYLNGIAVKQSATTALVHFKKAAEQGSPDAQFNLGSMYFSGQGVKQDHSVALRYFTLAAGQSHTRAIFNLALMHLHGMATPTSCTVAIKLLKTVAERGEQALWLKEAHADYLEGHDLRSFLFYLQAAEQGFEVAQHNAAWLLEQEDVVLDIPLGFTVEALPLTPSIRSSSSQPLESASVVPASVTSPPKLESWGMDMRRRLALRLWQRAAEQGNAEASRKVGDYYYEGVPAVSTAVVSPDAQPSPTETIQPPGNEPTEVPPSRPDFEAAADAYLVAADARDPQAMFNIGYRRVSVLVYCFR